MYLWRSLPEGQLLAVLRWMSTRRECQATDKRLASEAAPATVEAGDKSTSPTR